MGDTMIVPITSLIVGLIVGYVGQRTRMCFVGGLRDFLLVRDVDLLKGLAAFALTAWIAFPLAHMFRGGTTSFALGNTADVALALVGGAGIGIVSVLANGCPVRQHVMAAQGSVSAIAYVVGFLGGAVVFHWLAPAMAVWLP